MSLFSIIIPIKNKEKYISRTLKSCFKQSLSSRYYDVIVVNDCSNDGSLRVINRFKKKYNFKLINNLKTLGPGISRNIALKHSKTDYILFLDADDELKIDALKKLKKLTISKPDLIGFNFDKKINSLKLKNYRKDLNKINKSRRRIIQNFLKGKIDGSVIFTCFNLKFIKKNKIKFPFGLHEDIFFIFKCYFFAKKIKILNKSVYLKNEVKNSITKTYSKERIIDLLKVHNKMISFLKKKKKFSQKLYEYAYSGFVGYASDTIKEIRLDFKIEKNKKKLLFNIINNCIHNFSKPKKYNYKTKKDKLFINYIMLNMKKN